MRMDELRAERRALMTLMAAGASDDRRPLAQQRPPEAVPVSALSLRGRGQPTTATARYEDVDRL